MGSVISNIKCPNCGSMECYEDFYYRVYEVFINCPDCGFNYSLVWKKDEEGNLIRKDETKDFGFDNLIRVENKLDKPFCAYQIEYDKGNFILGSFETESDFNVGLSKFNEHPNKPEVKLFTISKFIDGVIKREIIHEKQ